MQAQPPSRTAMQESSSRKEPYTPRGFVARPGSFDAVVSGTVAKRTEQDNSGQKTDPIVVNFNDSLEAFAEISSEDGEDFQPGQEEAPSRPPRIRPTLLSSGYSTATSKEEDFVVHGQSRCVAGTPVKLASEFSNHPEWPWLRVYAGKEGKLVKQVGSGWGWIARFGQLEGTFRVRDGIHMLAYSKATTDRTPRRDGDPGTAARADDSHGGAKKGLLRKAAPEGSPRSPRCVPAGPEGKDGRRGSGVDRQHLQKMATQGRLRMHFAPIERRPHGEDRTPNRESAQAAFRWGRVQGHAPGVNPFALSATGPDRTIAFLMQKYKAHDVADVPTHESKYQTSPRPRSLRASTAAAWPGSYIDAEGQGTGDAFALGRGHAVRFACAGSPLMAAVARQEVELSGPGQASSLPVTPYGGWQRRERPATARYTSRAPDLKHGVRLRPSSASAAVRSNGASHTALQRPGPAGIVLDLRKVYGRVEAPSRPSARQTQRLVVDGEPTCKVGAEVRVASGYDWEGLEAFRGHVGRLTRREGGKGWHVFFPALQEEAFFLTSAQKSMLAYSTNDVAEIPQAHIFANQLKYSLERGQGPDAFTSLRFHSKCSAQLSFRSDKDAGGGEANDRTA